MKTTKKYAKEVAFSALICLSAALSFLACSNDDTLMENRVADQGSHTYLLRLDMEVPSFDATATRAATAWENGSQVNFMFYNSQKDTVLAVATYNASQGQWTLKTQNGQLSGSGACKACYVKYHDTAKTCLLAEKYSGENSWKLANDGSISVSMRLKPLSWRLRMQGTSGTKVTFGESDIRESVSPIKGLFHEGGKIEGLTLTVQTDGCTPYIYGDLVNGWGANTILVEIAGQQYKRTIRSTDLKVGESGYFAVPTDANYSTEGWTKIVVEVPDELQLSAETLNLAADGAAKELTVTSNTEWQLDATKVPAWLHVTPTSGNGNAEVTITADANTSLQARTGQIVFATNGKTPVSRSVSVTQAGATPFTTLALTELSFGSEAATKTFAISSNEEWTATSDATTWCTVSPTSGTGTATVTVSVAANATTSARTAHITVKGKNSGQELKLSVTQSAMGWYTTVSDTEFSVAPGGDSLNLTIDSNEPWTVVSDNTNWCTVTPASGNGQGSVTISVYENTSESGRTARVTVSGTNSSTKYVVVVTQKSKTPPSENDNPLPTK